MPARFGLGEKTEVISPEFYLSTCVIPDLTKKISTVRSRNISMSVIFQNLAQMQNRYPNNQWAEITGNCDTQLFLGCTDDITARYISDRTGEVTIGVSSESKQLETIRMSDYTPQYRETSSVGRRKLMTPDEVLRLDIKKAIIISRGEKILIVDKFDYSKHPESKKLVNFDMRDYIPKWKRVKKSVRKKSNDEKEITEENQKIISKDKSININQDKSQAKQESKKNIERSDIQEDTKKKDNLITEDSIENTLKDNGDSKNISAESLMSIMK